MDLRFMASAGWFVAALYAATVASGSHVSPATWWFAAGACLGGWVIATWVAS